MVKKAAKQLLQEQNSFNEEFNHNKRVLGGDTMPSKPIRNKIAGYISRLNKMRRIEQEELAKGIVKKKVQTEEANDGQYVQ